MMRMRGSQQRLTEVATGIYFINVFARGQPKGDLVYAKVF